MADQALHAISNGLREQASPDDDTGILLTCLCLVSSRWKRYGRSWKKTVWNSDAEDILIETALSKQGSANKGFASAGDYYQSMREHKLVREAMANLHTDAFEQ